jgi:predicted lipoprotein with Yx(FWY)xxD motif
MNRKKPTLLAALGAAALLQLSGCATDPATVPAKVNPMGAYTTLNGDPLFAYEGDPRDIASPGPWVPLLARADDRSGRDFGVVSQPDGTLQWVFRGLPVYYYNGDDTGRSRDPAFRAGKWKLLNYPYGGGRGAGSGGH